MAVDIRVTSEEVRLARVKAALKRHSRSAPTSDFDASLQRSQLTDAEAPAALPSLAYKRACWQHKRQLEAHKLQAAARAKRRCLG